MTEPQDRVSELYNTIAEAYDSGYDVASHRRVYDQLAWEHVSSLQLPAGATIVDVGCGTGRWIPRLLERGHYVIGIERASGMIDLLRARKLGPAFTLIESSMESARVPRASADLVLALGSVQYALDPAAMIRRFASWTRPGGAVCVYVDSLVSLVLELLREGKQSEAMERLQTRRGKFRQGDKTAPLYLHDRRTLEAHFAAAGLVDVRCHGLAVSASALGRAGCGEAMANDENSAMALERLLSADPAMADSGLHIMAIGHKPAR
ncbi:class I SAM-dependent methyltransferase [Lichenicoccus sp.]|uniref:class I SAM-dependent methyltransferase n=1 Tax=Lichenicoccus sp. TaxID=2781899 RepID=UPI003D14C8D3